MLGADLTVVATKWHRHMVGPTTTNHCGNDRAETASSYSSEWMQELSVK
jgi:hypothetical protein